MTMQDLIVVLCLLGKGIGNVTSESARNGFAFCFNEAAKLARFVTLFDLE